MDRAKGKRSRRRCACLPEVFEDPASYLGAQPGEAYADKLLANPGFILLTAHVESVLVGALAAYELIKFEQERSEVQSRGRWERG